MNKKGFTLVELLAVIAILAILVIIALPNVLSMFNKAKKDTFASESKDMVRIAQQQYLADFGKFTRYAVEGSKASDAADATPVTTIDCEKEAAQYDRVGESNYCKINKDAGNLSTFIIEFNVDNGKVERVLSSDSTYSYHFPNKDKTVFDSRDIVDNGFTDK